MEKEAREAEGELNLGAKEQKERKRKIRGTAEYRKITINMVLLQQQQWQSQALMSLL